MNTVRTLRLLSIVNSWRQLQLTNYSPHYVLYAYMYGPTTGTVAFEQLIISRL